MTTPRALRSSSASSSASRGVSSRSRPPRRADAGLVERDVGERQRLAAGGRVAAQQRPHPRAQLVGVERLDQVVVGAGVQPGDALVDRVAGGEQQDRHAQALRAQPAGDREPVHAGHRHVEHDRVRHRALDRGQRGAAVRGRLDRRSPPPPASARASAGSAASSSTSSRAAITSRMTRCDTFSRVIRVSQGWGVELDSRDRLARDRDPDRRSADPGRARARAASRGALPAVVGRGAYRVVRDALATPTATGRRWRSSSCRARWPCRSTHDGDGRDLDEVAELAAALGGGLTAASRAGRLPGAGVAADRRPAAVSRSAARSALSAGPPRAAAADRAEDRARAAAPRRRRGSTTDGSRSARTRSGSSVTA